MAGWPAIEAYMAGQFTGVAERHTNEGAVQAMLCANGGEWYQVIDREAVFGFPDTRERERVHEELRRPLLNALDVPTPEGWWRPPASLGGELDILAVDARGRLLVMEVKPADSLSGITWAPLQVSFYARLFRHWSEAVGGSRRRSSTGCSGSGSRSGWRRCPVSASPLRSTSSRS
jgi:hypothetical protein